MGKEESVLFKEEKVKFVTVQYVNNRAKWEVKFVDQVPQDLLLRRVLFNSNINKE